MDILLQAVEGFKPDFIDITLAGVIVTMAGAFWVFIKGQWKDLKDNGDKMAAALALASRGIEDNIDWMKSVDSRLETNKDVLNSILSKLEP